MEGRFFGLTTRDVRHIAFQVAERNKIPHNFNKTVGLAGDDWLYGFRKRHPEISLRIPEATSAANKNNVGKFFDLLEGLMDQHAYPKHRVYNCDETALTTVQTKASKVFAMKAKPQVGTLTSAERGQLATVVITMAAGGQFIPPFIIFPRVRMKMELLDGTPPGTGYACHPSGWMQSDIFILWFKHFIKHTHPSKEDPVLLVLDGHVTHTKNLALIELAEANFVTLLVLPPHCTHKLQPLDVAMMKPLNTYFTQSIETYLRNNPGRVVTMFQIGRLFGEAYLRAAVPTTAIHGFEKTGIAPVNRHVFTDADFLAADVTEIEIVDLTPGLSVPASTIGLSAPASTTGLSVPASTIGSSASASTTGLSAPASTIGSSASASTTGLSVPASTTGLSAPASTIGSSASASTTGSCAPTKSDGASSEFVVFPKQIIRIPKVAQKERTHKARKYGSSVILTTPSYKKTLIEATTKGVSKGVTKRCYRKTVPKKTLVKDVIKKQKLSTSKTDPVKDSRRMQPRDLPTTSTRNAGDNVLCIYCSETYNSSKSGEMWVMCEKCQNWAHELCADNESGSFICEFCAPYID